jgi:hypothetical protein
MAQAILVYSESPLNHALLWQNISVSALFCGPHCNEKKNLTLILKPVQKGLPLLRRKMMYCKFHATPMRGPIVLACQSLWAPPSILFLECKWRHAYSHEHNLTLLLPKETTSMNEGFCSWPCYSLEHNLAYTFTPKRDTTSMNKGFCSWPFSSFLFVVLS